MRRKARCARLRLPAFFSLLLLACTGYKTSDLLDAKFLAKDLTAIDLLAPSDRSVSPTRTPSFSWSRRAGATKYLLEISTDVNFATLVLKKTTTEPTYTLANADLYAVTALDAFSYYWRVTAIYPDQQVTSGRFVFHILDDAIVYVNGNSTATEQVGNKGAPFKKIQSGIEAADTKRNGVSGTAMEVIVAAGTYNEEVNLRPGISIRGGYEAIDWTRNISVNTTSINAPSTFAVRGNSANSATYLNTTEVQGFTIRGGNSTGTSNFGVQLVQAFVKITNNTIFGGTGNSNYCIELSTGSGPIIEGNNLFVASGTGRYGISIGTSSAPIIRSNVIAISTGGNAAYGIEQFTNATVTISNNLILVQSALTNYGIYLNLSSSPTISNNTIHAGTAGTSYGVFMNSSSRPNVRNNIIFSSGGTSYCVFENDSTSDVTSLQNNNLYGCATALYRDGEGSNCAGEGSANCLSITNIENDLNAEVPGTASGNVSINNAGGQLFVDIDGSDNNLNTMVDNDWHLTTNLAVCDVRGGALNLSGSFTTDKDGLTRTISAITGCTPTNTGATNWSMGAYESN